MLDTVSKKLIRWRYSPFRQSYNLVGFLPFYVLMQGGNVITLLIIVILCAVPVVSYINMDTLKEKFIIENRKKSGIYCIKNNENGKKYVGSSSNITSRFYMYYSLYHITLRKNSLICRALLKYGYTKFSVEILEYCDPSVLIEREQYYIDLLKPEYNLLKLAGSSIPPPVGVRGYKILESTKTKISQSKTGIKHKAETLIKLRKHLAEFNKSKSLKVEVTDVTTKQTIIYDSIPKAAEDLDCSTTTISNWDKKISQGTDKLYKEKFHIKIIR